MPFEAPKIDPRTAREITEQVEQLLANDQQDLISAYVPEWKYTFYSQPDAIRSALVAVFARYAELVIERLNRVPDKNLLAFLDMLGASLLPPQPARAPLTFSLSSGSAIDGIVPAGTQVSAAPLEGEKEPVVFETETELVVMAAQLSSIFTHEPAADRYRDDSEMIGHLLPDAVSAFSGDLPIEHVLYVGHDTAFDYPDLSRFILKAIGPKGANRAEVAWEIWDGICWKESKPVVTTLAAYGADQESIESSIPATRFALLPLRVAGQKKKWLRGRLKSSISNIGAGNNIRPALFSVEYAQAEKAAIKYAFANDAPLDVQNAFLPFGEQPKLNDTLYIAVKDAASAPQEPYSRLILDIEAIKIEQGNFEGRTVEDTAKLVWEFWNGKAWSPLNPLPAPAPVSTDTRPVIENPAAATLTNLDTIKLTRGKRDIVLDFSEAKPCAVNGIQAYWIRVRIGGGSYGEPAKYKGDETTGWRFIPPRYILPSITAIRVSYINRREFDLGRAANAEGLVVLTYNDFSYEQYDFTPPAKAWPFRASAKTEAALYLGFTLPGGLTRFPNQKTSILVCIQEAARSNSASIARLISPSERPVINWAYSSSSSIDGWARLFVRDGTANFSRSGIVEFLAPADFAARREFARDNTYWLRAVVQQEQRQPFDPKLRGVFANTVMAAHAITINHEILGSSDGSRNQKYRTTHQPILTGQRLEVREPDRPSAAEIDKIKRDLELNHEEKIVRANDADEIESEGWVQWVEVNDFYGSEANDRHYVVDHLSGEIRFGDGQSGKLPPAGSANIRLKHYRTGGGRAGNREAGAITQLKTTVPYIDGVTNPLPATGGAEGETHVQLIDRAPRMVRHRGRAVTIEDYEDLARLASPDVARARCVPLYDLSRKLPVDASQKEFGTISLIIVPYSKAPYPLPSMELIARVYEYVSSRHVPVVKLVVVGPTYIRFEVEVNVAVTSIDVANEVELATAAALTAFLHPLTGGLNGNGWDFGRWPHASNFYRLIEAIPGVNYVRSLKLFSVNDATGERTQYIEEQQGARGIDYSMVYSGTHKIEVSYGD